MTTTVTTALQRHAAVPFRRLVRIELRKLLDTRSGRWLLIAVLALTPLVVVGALFVAEPRQLTFDNLVNWVQTPQKLLLPVVGILSVTGEWSQRTGLVTFTLEPRRGRVLLAKTAATLALGVVVVIFMVAIAAVGNAVATAVVDGNGSWTFGPAAFGEIMLVQLLGLLLGLAIGTALLHSAAAVVVFFLVPNLWSTAFSAVPSLAGARPWFDLNDAQGNLYNHQMTGAAWLHLLVAVLLWVGLPALVGVCRVGRSEVKSG